LKCHILSIHCKPEWTRSSFCYAKGETAIRDRGKYKNDTIIRPVKIRKSKNSGALGIKIAKANRFIQSINNCDGIRSPVGAIDCLKIPPKGLSNHVYPEA
jgi:hypothetical protein